MKVEELKKKEFPQLKYNPLHWTIVFPLLLFKVQMEEINEYQV